MNLDGLPQGVDPVLVAAARAAVAGYVEARAAYGRVELAETVAEGADGTPTMRIDVLVESRILDAIEPSAVGRTVNVLSEEMGTVDRGSAVTLVMDPLDGSANGAAGVPLTAFSAALAVDGEFTEALTVWTDTGRWWWAKAGDPGPYRMPGTGGTTEAAGAATQPALCHTSGRTGLDGAAVSLLRPQPARPGPAAAWWAVASPAARIRILSSSCLEAALVAEGATDAFADAATDTHRLMDLAAALVIVPAAGGAVRDVFGRPIEFDPDLTRRWSGVVAATPALADELATTLREAGQE